MSWSAEIGALLSAAQISFTDECSADLLITGLTIDSREVSAGCLFCAYPGSTLDGRNYIDQAIKNGAIVILAEANGFDDSIECSVPVIKVAGLQYKIGFLANSFFGQPSSKMQVFGVTGTNGKTTCCYLLAQAFQELGMQSGVIGTLGYGELGNIASGSLTTPDAINVHRHLAELYTSGVTQACMEVSSHALDQGRVLGVQFFCTLFTNLSHDHLDYHGDMQSYGAVKSLLFTQYQSELAILNADDPLGHALSEQTSADFVVSYGDNGDIRADEVVANDQGLIIYVDGSGVDFELTTPLIGLVNVPNIMLLVAALLGLSVEIKDIQAITAKLEPAPGRMELFQKDGEAAVVVDYAHTPDALEKALLSVREHCIGDLWCVFGCGGDRDKEKRAVMGAVAGKHADHVIVTNDNPRGEAPQAIANEILAGFSDAHVILDRSEAICSAISSAKQNDWVLVAGKGHETTQTIGAEILSFSDREQVEQALGVAA